MQPISATLLGASVAGTARSAAKAVASPFLQLLHAAGRADAPQPSAGVELAALQSRFASLRNHVADELRNVFTFTGPAADSRVSLEVAKDGSLGVTGDPAGSALVEQALADDPELEAEVRELLALSQLLQAATEHQEFARFYAEDPWQTPQRTGLGENHSARLTVDYRTELAEVALGLE